MFLLTVASRPLLGCVILSVRPTNARPDPYIRASTSREAYADMKKAYLAAAETESKYARKRAVSHFASTPQGMLPRIFVYVDRTRLSFLRRGSLVSTPQTRQFPCAWKRGTPIPCR